MRRPTHGDAVSVARVLLGTRPVQRRWVLLRLFREAAVAAAWVARTGRGHPRWGDGSLIAAALRRKPASEPSLASPDYCRCLAMTYAALGEAEI